jgi:hypothetical protein
MKEEEMDSYLKKLDNNESNLGEHFGITKKEDKDSIKAIWKPIQYDDPITEEKLGHILKIIRFRELACRSALDSSRAWIINSLQKNIPYLKGM